MRESPARLWSNILAILGTQTHFGQTIIHSASGMMFQFGHRNIGIIRKLSSSWANATCIVRKIVVLSFQGYTKLGNFFTTHLCNKLLDEELPKIAAQRKKLIICKHLYTDSTDTCYFFHYNTHVLRDCGIC